jgi:hypothetical protein
MRVSIVVGLLALSLLSANCGTLRSLGHYIGQEESLIAKLIAAAAAASSHSAAEIRGAAEAAGSKIYSVSVDLIGESGTAKAKASLTELACQTIAAAIQSGKWPTTIETNSAAFDAVRGEVQPAYSNAQLAASVISLAESLWTGDEVNDEAVRNVVCVAVGVRF